MKSNQTELAHIPVLLNEVIEGLLPHPGGHYLDGTLGAGGHAKQILNASNPDGQLLGLDVDPVAIAIASERLNSFGNRFQAVNQSYVEMKPLLSSLNWPKLDGILLDLGASSMQFNEAQRGFSFSHDGPLDMRFDPNSLLTASEIVNEWPQHDIATILRDYGEEKRYRKIAQSIVANRPISSTAELAKIVSRALRAKKRGIHPATRTFQALRIAVNSELENIKQVLPDALSLLKSKARLLVISFHSLEDRIVKQFMNQESKDCICPPEKLICDCEHTASLKKISKKPIVAQDIEINKNPRSRSAKLRIAERI